MAAKKSLYEILGVEPDANDLDIGLAFQRRTFELKRMAHVDPNAVALVQQAHEILSNPKRREAYDASRVTAAEKAAAADQATDLVLEGGEEEAPSRPKWMFPAIAAVVVLIVVGFFMTRGPAPEKPAPVVEAPKAAPPPPPKPLTAEQLLPMASRASGEVLSYGMSGRGVPVGIGVSYEPGTIVTTCHGLAAGSKPVFRQGAETISAELQIVDEVLDLCRLSIVGSSSKTLSLSNEELKAGDKVFTLGMNDKGEFVVNEGVVKQLKTMNETRIIELSTPVSSIGSGGPVLDSFGRVVGIATAPHKFGNVNAAIASSSIADMRSRTRTP
jgi:S1-C subfamily serine protease